MPPVARVVMCTRLRGRGSYMSLQLARVDAIKGAPHFAVKLCVSFLRILTLGYPELTFDKPVAYHSSAAVTIAVEYAASG